MRRRAKYFNNFIIKVNYNQPKVMIKIKPIGRLVRVG